MVRRHLKEFSHVPTVLMVGAHAEDPSIEEHQFIAQMIYQLFDGKPF